MGTAIGADGVQVALEWQAEAAPENNGQWFVHLLDPNGEVVAQQDRGPQSGCRPVNSWAADETVTDRLYFALPEVGEGWSLRVGWLDANGEPVAVTGPDGDALDAPYVLVPLAGR